MSKKNLFIIMGFGAGGAEREMYELDKVLKEKKIDFEILCLLDLDKHNKNENFFYEKHLALGTSIHFFYELVFSKADFMQKIKNRFVHKVSLANKQKVLNPLLKKFDNVFFMGEYTYKFLETIIYKDTLLCINIFCMSSRFQGTEFRDINKNNYYRFISGFRLPEHIAYEFESFSNYEHVFFQLNLEVTEKYRLWKYHRDANKAKIGVFTRLSKAKPLDPFFYSLQVLMAKLPNVELHIFGGGSLEQAEYDRYIKHLGIGRHVIFRGHQDNMKDTINKECLDLVWFQGNFNELAGYAALDVALTGTPQLFWDFYEGINPQINDITVAFPHFKNLLRFVDASYMVIQNSDFAIELANRQYNEVYRNRNMLYRFNEIEYLFR